MALLDGRRFSRPKALVRNSLPVRPWNPNTALRAFAIALGMVLFSIWAASFPAAAQTTVNDVHVMPREAEKPKREEAANQQLATLNTHVRALKASVDLVLVPVTITDPMNRLVTGLDKENFELFEGNAKEEIKTFSSEDAPVSLGVIFDSSGSMSSKMDRAKDAVVEFFKTANPQDEFFMITFSDE